MFECAIDPSVSLNLRDVFFPRKNDSPPRRRRRATRRLFASIVRNNWEQALSAIPFADLGFEDPISGYTPLTQAIVCHRIAMVRLICDRLCGQNASAIKSQSLGFLLQSWPLHNTQAGVFLDCLDCLVGGGSLPSWAFPSQGSWLFLSLPSDNLALAKVLYARGCHPSEKGVGGEGLLHAAIEYEAFDVFRWALERGADINARDSFGETPLHAAARHGLWAWADCLLRAGADPDILNPLKQTPLSLASGHSEEGMFWQAQVRLSRFEAALIPGGENGEGGLSRF